MSANTLPEYIFPYVMRTFDMWLLSTEETAHREPHGSSWMTLPHKILLHRIFWRQFEKKWDMYSTVPGERHSAIPQEGVPGLVV